MMITVKVFAGLKKYFDQELNLQSEESLTISEVKEMLGLLHPDSIALLTASRFAVSEEFVPATYELKHGEELYILPPSSGG